MACTNHNLTRRELQFPDGEKGRIYECVNCDIIAPSVTTVLDRREDEGKKRALKYWRQKNNGKGDNADHTHLLAYKGWRGTLVHFNILHQLDDSLTPTSEEHDALENINDHSTDYPWVYSMLHDRADTRDELKEFKEHFPDKSEYDGRSNSTLREIGIKDISWATQEFFNHTNDLGLADVGYENSGCNLVMDYVDEYVRTKNVIDTESYIPIDDGLCGQFDAIYEKSSGETVLLDLKCSSGIRYSHECQLCAYANAIETHGTSSDTVSTDSNSNSVDTPIDTLCIFRTHPESQETEIQWETDFNHSRSTYMSEFNELRDQVASLVQQLDDDTTQTEVTA